MITELKFSCIMNIVKIFVTMNCLKIWIMLLEENSRLERKFILCKVFSTPGVKVKKLPGFPGGHRNLFMGKREGM